MTGLFEQVVQDPSSAAQIVQPTSYLHILDADLMRRHDAAIPCNADPDRELHGAGFRQALPSKGHQRLRLQRLLLLLFKLLFHGRRVAQFKTTKPCWPKCKEKEASGNPYSITSLILYQDTRFEQNEN